MERRTFLKLAALVPGLALAGCGGSKTLLSPKDPTMLSIWHVYGEQADSPMNRLLTEFNDKVLKRGKAEPEDLLILTINKKAIEDIANDGEQLYKSLNDLVLYATGAAACSTSDLLMVMEAINGSLDDIERHLNRAYMETWRYIQVRIGYWKEKIYQARSRQEIIDGAFGRWRGAGRLDY